MTNSSAGKRYWSILVGLLALALAVSAFIPSLSPDSMVWGLFDVNDMHNLIHFITAVLAFYAAFNLNRAVTIWRVLAVFFGATTLLGLFTGDGQILGLVDNNWPDVLLHAGKTAIFAFLGWGGRQEELV